MLSEMGKAVLSEMNLLLQKKKRLLIAVDGRCAAGKTTLAAELAAVCGCNVVHMDHFFLRPEQRTVKRLEEAGGNIDYERFFAEVLLPWRKGVPFSYQPYDCKTGQMAEAVQMAPNTVTVVEGSYSCHPAFGHDYDWKIFLTVGKEEQLRRIQQRNGAGCAVQFQQKWIPLEERYFSAFCIQEGCDVSFQTG